MKIYVASSWRNEYQPAVVELCKATGHHVYDFRNPPYRAGFGWEQIAGGWRSWTTGDYIDALNHPLAVEGFRSDKAGMDWADMGILVLPSGRSAHTEAGWMQGRGMPVYVFTPGTNEPELMYKIFCGIIATWDDLRLKLLSFNQK
jgi:hypothetical protein